MTPRRALRRLLPATMTLWLVTTACSGSSSGPGTATQFCLSSSQGNQCIAELARGAVHLSMIAAQDQLTTGKSLFTFGLTTDQGGLLTGGSPQVFIAKNRQSPPQGPFVAGFYEFTPNPDDKSPRSPITGFY